MSNNRNNNRRRGRGSNRSQGGNQLNRIDSRARGNAPQLLEKYKKLAHDSALNGDRVQSEYYLQFADHYFRVIADTRSQKDDGRGPRRDSERERGEYDEDFEEETDRGSQESRSRREDRDDEAQDNGDGVEEGRRERDASPAETGNGRDEDENPFTRENRVKPQRRTRRPRAAATESSDEAGSGLDPSALPPAIGREDAQEETPAPAPKPRRTRARRKDDDETLEAVG